MLQYYYHLVAIFTLTSVLVYVIVLDLTMEVSWLRVYVFQASRCIHSDTVACLVNRGRNEKKTDAVWGLTKWHFSGHMTWSTKTNQQSTCRFYKKFFRGASKHRFNPNLTDDKLFIIKVLKLFKSQNKEWKSDLITLFCLLDDTWLFVLM